MIHVPEPSLAAMAYASGTKGISFPGVFLHLETNSQLTLRELSVESFNLRQAPAA